MSAAALFASMGLAPKKAEEAAANDKLREALLECASAAGLPAAAPADGSEACPKAVGLMLYDVATKVPAFAAEHRPALARLVGGGGMSAARVSVAVSALKKLKPGAAFGEAELKKAVGYGEELTEEALKAAADAVFDKNGARVEEDRFRAAPVLMGALRGALPAWVEGARVKGAVDAGLLARLGEPTAADKEKPAKKKKKAKDGADGKKKGKKSKKSESKEAEAAEEEAAPDLAEGRMIKWAINTKEQEERHLRATGGKIRTRFPPEPNGYLHLGHCKAMNFSFTVAAERGGETYLRFDDTNPSAEKGEYIREIKENVAFMGFTPAEVTFSSDYFDEMYELAVRLIRSGLAYVCFQSKAEMAEGRRTCTDSPWRNTPVDENVRLFEDMRRGKFAEGECSLRMKGDMKHDNMNMRDHVAYRIQYREHPHVGARWCIYPSYDFTHCIIDSLENVTHSLCTLEFEVRRESYFWLLDKLDLYKPKVWEYSRLNVAGNVMSKRKLKALVEEGHVRGWDDPRLLTINGLRRRGYTAEALRDFCRRVGVTRSANTISPSLLELCAREDLNERATRAMVVVDPLRVVLTNYPADRVESFEAPAHPSDPSRGTRALPFSRVIYVERSDFRREDSKGYRRLAPGKSVHLRFAYDITCTGFEEGDNGEVVELHATVDTSEASLGNAKNLPGKVHWVAEPAPGREPLALETREYGPLFLHDDPGSQDNWRDLLNARSLVTRRSFAEPSVAASAPGDKLQFERIGYYTADPDSSDGAPVFNLTVSLKAGKF